MQAQDTPQARDERCEQITVWACPICGYWRSEESTGVHQAFPKDGRGRGERHVLEPTTYVRVC